MKPIDVSTQFSAFLKMLFVPILAMHFASAAFAQDPLGSTATLEQIQSKRFLDNLPDRPKPAVVSIPEIATVEAAPTKTAALSIQFWPHYLRLKTGAGKINFSRAAMIRNRLSRDYEQEWQRFYNHDSDTEIPTVEEISKFLGPYRQVINELRAMADCEELAWDLRIRDLPPGEAYQVSLDEAQLSRDLGRILIYDACQNLQQGKFDEAIESIRAGFRLAHLVRTGETLVHQLIGIAIENSMYDCVDLAIRTPGCPNLYFALASIPDQREALVRAMQMEQHFGMGLFPALVDAERGLWTEDQGRQYWRETLPALQSITGSPGDPTISLYFTQLVVNASAEEIRARLIASGYSHERLDKMLAAQLLAIETRQQLADHYRMHNAVPLVDYAVSGVLLSEIESNINDPATRRQPSGIFGNMLLPSIQLVHDAHQRSNARREMLLTVEAVRDFIARNDGRFPQSIEELKRLSPGRDPFTGEPISYSVAEIDGAKVATFSLDVPQHIPARTRQLKMIIKP